MKSIKNIKNLKKEIEKIANKIIKMKNDGEDFNEIVKYELILLDKKKELYTLLLQDKNTTVKSRTAKELLESVPKKPVFWETGFPFIDMRLGGIPKGSFIQFGASSESGKTTWSIALALSMARTKKIVHFNFEMNDYLLAKKLRMFNPDPVQLNNYYIDDKSSKLDLLMMELELYALEGFEFFVIDSRMKIKVENAFSKSDAASRISESLSRFCQQNNVTVILINQLSEESQRTGMPNLKESGDQLYDADMVWFLLKEVKTMPKDGKMIEFHDDFRIFRVFKNRYDEDGSGHFSVRVRKDEIIPNISIKAANEIEPDLSIDDISIDIPGI